MTAKPMFDRVDLKIVLLDGMESDTIVIYHDDLLAIVLLEALRDAERINGTLVVVPSNRQEVLTWARRVATPTAKFRAVSTMS
jgi:hypothetical protein